MTKRRSKVARLLKGALTNNLGLKLLSVAASIALFSLVHGAEDDERSLFVDVEAQLPPPSSGKMLVSELPDKLKLTLRGRRSMLESVEPGDLGPVTIDLRDTERSYYYFDPDEFELPASIQLVQLAPASIPLTWADRLERRVPVELRLVGVPGPGLEARPVRVDPATVLVAGPEMEVQPLDVLETERIDVRGLDEGRHVRGVPLEEPPAHTKLAIVSVDATIEVAPEQAQRKLERVEVVPVGDGSVSVRPSRVDVTLWGPTALLEPLDPERIVPRITVPHDLEPGDSAREVQVELDGVPEGVDARVIPHTVLVERRKSAAGAAEGSRAGAADVQASRSSTEPEGPRASR